MFAWMPGRRGERTDVVEVFVQTEIEIFPKDCAETALSRLLASSVVTGVS